MVELIKELDAQTKESFKNFQSNFDAFHKNNEEKGQDKFFVKFQIIRFASELKKLRIIFELSLSYCIIKNWASKYRGFIILKPLEFKWLWSFYILESSKIAGWDFSNVRELREARAGSDVKFLRWHVGLLCNRVITVTSFSLSFSSNFLSKYFAQISIKQFFDHEVRLFIFYDVSASSSAFLLISLLNFWGRLLLFGSRAASDFFPVSKFRLFHLKVRIIIW